MFYSDRFSSLILHSTPDPIRSKQLKIEEAVDIEVLSIFKQWIYSWELVDKDKKERHAISISTLYKVWSFGDAFSIPILQNEAMNAIWDNVRTGVICSIVTLTGHTTPNSASWRMWIHVAALVTPAPGWSQYAIDHHVPGNIHLGMIKTLKTSPPRTMGWHNMDRKDRCLYHVHRRGGKCHESTKYR